MRNDHNSSGRAPELLQGNLQKLSEGDPVEVNPAHAAFLSDLTDGALVDFALRSGFSVSPPLDRQKLIHALLVKGICIPADFVPPQKG